MNSKDEEQSNEKDHVGEEFAILAPARAEPSLGPDHQSQGHQKSEKKSLWPFYYQIETCEYSDPLQAYRLIEDILEEGLDRYTAPPDTWHNAAMVAGRVQHRDAQLLLVEAGLNEWPDNVDLLCDAMSYRQTTHYDPERLEQIWNKLSSMDRQKTAPYWRFWVYAATYYALERDDPKTAEEFLDKGLCSVRRDAVMDILRSYRRIYVDSVPLSPLESDDSVTASQEEALDKLERRFKLGIQLGVENAYVLATELARLYQERAGCTTDKWPEDLTAEGKASRKRDDYLTTALAYLDLAEKLYTGNTNHPIWDIYESRIRIQMAQRRYGDALKLLRSLPQARLRADPSLSTLLSLASEMTGEKLANEQAASKQNAHQLDEGQISPQRVLENLETVFNTLLGNDGEILFQVACQNPQVREVLSHVMLRLQHRSN